MTAGILIMSPSLKVLYRNRTAERLIAHLNGGPDHAWSGRLPDSLVRFCKTVSQAHLERSRLGEHEPITTCDSVIGSRPSIQVHGYGLSIAGTPHRSHLVIVLDKLN
jgi:hypothetical protein